jgi:hypothetical protein
MPERSTEPCRPPGIALDPRIGVVFFVAATAGLAASVLEAAEPMLAVHGRMAAEGFSGLEYGRALGLALVAAAPMIALAWASIAVFRIGLVWSAGDRLTERMASRVKDLGEALLSAAVWSALLTPNLLRWIPGEGGFVFRPTELAIAAFIAGVLFAAAADLIRDAARREAEAELFV